MSKEKKGGARLDKSIKAKQAAQGQRTSPPPQPRRPAPQQHAPGQPGAPQHRKPVQPVPKKKKKRIALRVLLIILAILAALIIGFFIWYKFFWAVLPDLPAEKTPPPDAALPTMPAASTTLDPDTGEETATPVSDRKEGYYTFLLVGRDVASGGTDTMMLASYDIPNQTLNIMSVPRDTMVDARHPGTSKRLNAVYNLGKRYAPKDDPRTGIDYLKEAYGDMMGFTPDFYVFINWEAFGRLVDAIGGVYFDVPRNMNYDDPAQNLHIHQSAGYRLLSGDDAMQIVRWRHDNFYASQYADGDLGRIRTQQDLMKAIIKQCLQIKNVTKISEFAEIFTDEVETDLTLGNLVAFAERAILGGLTMENVTFMTMPNKGVYVGKASYVQAVPEELVEVLNTYFNPYTRELTLDEMDIMQYSDARGFYTTRGDGKPRN